jgi:uncharacterized protein YodC (DUF2158 family)
MRHHSALFRESDLVLIADAPPPDSPELAVGDECELISGGPVMTVRIATPDNVVCSYWIGEETAISTFVRDVVRRVL